MQPRRVPVLTNSSSWEQKTQRLSAADQAGAAGRDSPPSGTRGPAALAIQPASEDSEYLWRADASITARVYNTNRQSAVRAASAELWDSTGLPRQVLVRKRCAISSSRHPRSAHDRARYIPTILLGFVSVFRSSAWRPSAAGPSRYL